METITCRSAVTQEEKTASGAATGKSTATLRERIAFTVFALVALTCILFLPYLVPVRPSVGYSYAFGFNNDAGIFLLLCFSAAGALWLRRRPLFALASQPNVLISRRTLVSGLLLTLFFCALAYPLVNRASPAVDAGYFVNRIHLLQSGKLPYVQFEFAYGPMMLYVPAWIADIFHIPIPAAYYIFWVVTELIGVLLVARVLNGIDIPSSARPAIFLLFCAASGAAFIIGSLAYTFVRFAIAPYLAMQIYELEAKLAHRKGASWTVASLVILSIAVLLLVSPEIALAFGVVYSAFLILQRASGTGISLMAICMVLAGFLGLLWLANRAHLLSTMKAFAGGAGNTPMVMSAHFLLFFLCVFLAVLHLVRSWPRWGRSSSCLLVLLSIPMLAAALGRCDPGHIFFSGWVFLAIGFIYLSRSKAAWDLTRIVFIVFFVIGLPVEIFLNQPQQFIAAFKIAAGKSAPGEQLSQSVLFPQSHGVLEAPYGFRSPSVEAFNVPWVDMGRFFENTNAITPQAITIKEQELEAHPDREVLVPSNFREWGKFNASMIRLSLEVIFVTPYFMPLRHPDSPYGKLAEFIERNYHMVSPASSSSLGYEIWARN